MAHRTKPINVGLIGCNRRALWYGAIFDDIDPNAYAALDPATYHHMTYYNYVELQITRAPGFRLAKVYDRDARAAGRVAAAFRTRPEVCNQLDEVSRGVDLVFIANESGDGSDHLELARPGLTKGVPTFVDRPFAATVKDARAMAALARRKRAPLFSCSHIRMLPHAARFKARFAEIGPVANGAVIGHGPNPAHMADGIELALYLFGDDFSGRVHTAQSMGSWPLEIMHLRYVDARSKRVLEAYIINSHTSAARYAFWAKAMGQMKSLLVDSRNWDAFVQWEGGLAVMNAIQEMARSGEAPLPYTQIIESVAVAEAGRKAHNKPHAVRLKILR